MVLKSTKVIKWIESNCIVPEGRLMGQPLKIHKPQREIIRGIYDSPTRTAIVSVGRKNTKTALSACLLLNHLAGPESRPNSQLYSSAMARKQAAVIFELAAKMVRMSPKLSKYIHIRDSAKQLICKSRGTVYTALSAEAGTAHGLSPVFVVHDELGQVRGPRSELFEALETAQGAHDDPLSIIISTQAPTDADLLSVLIDDAKLGADPKVKLFLWCADPADDPYKESTWKKANPMYGITLNPEVVKEQAEAARRMPSRAAAFRNLVLNQRIDQSPPFIARATWQACEAPPDDDVMRSTECYAGLDLSSRKDLTAFVWKAQDENRVWHVRADFFAPEYGVVDRARRDRAPYDLWAEQGWLTLVPGASIDYEWVAYKLAERCEEFDIVGIAFDRWRMDVLKKELDRIGAALPLVAWGQGFRDMSPALDATESAFMNHRIRHGGNPILTWCAANAKTADDPAGNRKLDKKKSTGRIDGMQALAMSFGASASMVEDDNRGPSVYESRGMAEIEL